MNDEFFMREALREAYLAAELGEEVPAPVLTERDGEFYLVDGLEAAMVRTFEMQPFIEARLSDAEPVGEYVKMRNSL